MDNSREEQLQADLANTALFFLLLFLVGSSLYYSFSDNVGWRSALYILTSLVAIASYGINKTKMDDLTLVLDRKNNICQFPSGQDI